MSCSEGAAEHSANQVCCLFAIIDRKSYKWGQTIVQIRWLLYRTPCNTGEGFQHFVDFVTGPLQFLYIDLNCNFSLLTGTLKDLNTFGQTTAGTSEGRRTKGRNLFLPLVLQSRGRDSFRTDFLPSTWTANIYATIHRYSRWCLEHSARSVVPRGHQLQMY